MKGAALAAKPINDTELLTINWSLPEGFGYVLNEINVNIDQDRANDWSLSGTYRQSHSSIVQEGFDYLTTFDFIASSNTGVSTRKRSTRITAGILPRTPIVPSSHNTPTFAISFTNFTATAALAGTVDALVSYFEYDLEQISFYPAHFAQAVITR